MAHPLRREARSEPAPVGRGLAGGAGLLGLWLLLWTFFLVAVAAPAGRFHAAATGLASGPSAVAGLGQPPAPGPSR